MSWIINMRGYISTRRSMYKDIENESMMFYIKQKHTPNTCRFSKNLSCIMCDEIHGLLLSTNCYPAHPLEFLLTLWGIDCYYQAICCFNCSSGSGPWLFVFWFLDPALPVVACLLIVRASASVFDPDCACWLCTSAYASPGTIYIRLSHQILICSILLFYYSLLLLKLCFIYISIFNFTIFEGST